MVKAPVLELIDTGSILAGGFLEDSIIVQLVMEDLEGGHLRAWN